jgi:hypothetical protein
MAKKAASQSAHTAALRSYAKVVLSRGRNVGHARHSQMASVRKAEHAGHSIEIRTHYEVKVDGKSVPLPLSVGDDGNVVCHALPNYLFSSAVDLVKTAIDVYPDDFAKRRDKRTGGRRPGGSSGHDHGGGAGSHGGGH